MKKIKVLAAILALAFVVGSAFTTNKSLVSDPFGYLSETAIGGGSKRYQLIDLQALANAEVTANCTMATTSHCKVHFATQPDSAQIVSRTGLYNEKITVEMPSSNNRHFEDVDVKISYPGL
jgi:hypothetical protein